MKVNFDREERYCEVIREEGDPHFTMGGYANAESTFLYHVLQELKRQGYDVIKKRMWKDGHMVNDLQQYIRTRSGLSKHEEFAIWNDHYAVYDAGLFFNKHGSIWLTVVLGDD